MDASDADQDLITSDVLVIIGSNSTQIKFPKVVTFQQSSHHISFVHCYAVVVCLQLAASPEVAAYYKVIMDTETSMSVTLACVSGTA